MTMQIRTYNFCLCLTLLSYLLCWSLFGAELSIQQRKTADALVAKSINDIQGRIVKDADLQANIKELSRREKKWQGWKPAMRIGFCAKQCRESHVPMPEEIDERVIDDIIWQYENAYGDGNDLNYHRQECARALGFIGDTKGVPTILMSVERESGHFSWQAL